MRIELLFLQSIKQGFISRDNYIDRKYNNFTFFYYQEILRLVEANIEEKGGNPSLTLKKVDFPQLPIGRILSYLIEFDYLKYMLNRKPLKILLIVI